MSKSKSKTKVAAVAVAVPQTPAEATDHIRRIGQINRDVRRIQAAMNDELAAVRERGIGRAAGYNRLTFARAALPAQGGSIKRRRHTRRNPCTSTIPPAS